METAIKNQVLLDLASLIEQHKDHILHANHQDLAACPKEDEALYDRLKVDDEKVKGMQASVLKVRQMDDPEGMVLYRHQKASDLLIENRVVPFGTILIIYESRPDVTIEAAITAFKAGNKILLKGGKEARKSNRALVDLWQQALAKNNQDTARVSYLDYDRHQTQALISDNTHDIDVIIPRGGEQLIQSIRENTDIPLIISGRGNNFLYIDQDADFDMALSVILDGKQRISVCNALDKVLIHQNLDRQQVADLVQALLNNSIEVLAYASIQSLNPAVQPINSEAVFYEEFLAPKILLAFTDELPAAIRTINRYSGGHSACIITNNPQTAQQFQHEIDCAAVYHNASTRFTDGGEFGLGAEIAISTQKLHFRGPVGLNELVTNKWFITGNGNIRG